MPRELLYRSGDIANFIRAACELVPEPLEPELYTASDDLFDRLLFPP